MEDKEIYLETKARLCAVLRDDSPTPFAMIVELTKEIDRYRKKIEHMETALEETRQIAKDRAEKIIEDAARMETMRSDISALRFEHEQTIKRMENDRYKQLSERVERLGQMVENKMEQVLGEYGQTLTSFVEERAADGGVMTIKKSMCYQNIVQILLSNGYFVCCHIDDDDSEEETITIEFWRA